MSTALMGFLAALGYTLLFVGGLHAVPRLGAAGRSLSRWLCRAPGLDLVVAGLTFVPWIAAGAWGSWKAVAGCVLGQVAALGVWCLAHEFVHAEAARGPRIVTFLNRTVGRARNHAALWVTAVSLPVFWSIRAAEIFTYPFLVWLLDFPRYRHADWVNVSRQKFDGLVGHDRIWCLYCDWMTGVYSLGAEMLRNVESFWCPIKFAHGKKCDNCKLDFPDLQGGWVDHDKSMGDVVKKMEEMYSPETGNRREWFGHPARLTVAGKELPSPAAQPEVVVRPGGGLPQPGENDAERHQGSAI
jgi:hypothetical protein